MALSEEDKQEIAEMIATAIKGASVEREEKEPHPTGPDFAGWEKNAIKSKRLTGVAIAPEDYYEIQEDGTKKTHFTWDEAMEIEKKTNGKWRLPTQGEWAVLADEFGTGEDGELDSAKLREALGLGLNGWADRGSGVRYAGSEGNYWSRTAYGDNYDDYDAYYLSLLSSNVYPQLNLNQYRGFSVRCVRDILEGE